MADVDLRRLQRAWQNDPNDLDVASEYIRELERSSGIPNEIGRVRDLRVGYAPPIELDNNNAQDRLLWERLAHFAKFMSLPNNFFEATQSPPFWLWAIRRLIIPINEEVAMSMVGPEGPGYEGPRYQKWHRVRHDIEEAHAKGYKYLVIRRIDPPRESGDVAMRRMQRQALTGDPRAQQQYERMRERRGLP